MIWEPDSKTIVIFLHIRNCTVCNIIWLIYILDNYCER